jgi:hypothetical protein
MMKENSMTNILLYCPFKIRRLCRENKNKQTKISSRNLVYPHYLLVPRVGLVRLMVRGIRACACFDVVCARTQLLPNNKQARQA